MMRPAEAFSALLLAVVLAGCVDDGTPAGHGGETAADGYLQVRVAAAKPASPQTQLSLPQAGISAPARVFVGEYAKLDGSASTDASSYQWTGLAPDGAPAALADSSFPQAMLQVEQVGAYTTQLRVTDPYGQQSQVATQIQAISQPQPLGFEILDAEYSDALDKVVAVSKQPDNALVILGTQPSSVKKIQLAYQPTAVSVSPDGLTAVVGHDAAITEIDLVAATVRQHYHNINFEIYDLALSEKGLAYASSPDYGQWDTLYEINLKTGVAQPVISDVFLLFAGGSRLQYQPAEQSIYTVDSALLPIDLNHFDASKSPAHWLRDSPYSGEYNMGGSPTRSNLWLSEDGQVLLTSGGTLFRTSAKAVTDMVYRNRLSDYLETFPLGGLLHADHSLEAASFAVISQENTAGNQDGKPATAGKHFLKTYHTPTLELESSIPLEGLDFNGSGEGIVPKFVFFNAAGTTRHALLDQGGETYLLAF